MARSVARPVAAAVLLAVAVGCGTKTDARPPRQPVRGTVAYNGKPPKGAVVTLWPLPLGGVTWRTVKPAGRVEADGSYQINTYDPGDGAVAGEYVVTVLWTGEDDDAPRPDLFGGKYSDPKKPVLKVTVKDGANDLPPIKLTGPPVRAAAVPNAPGS